MHQLFNKLVGVPYQWGGNDPKSGMDCFHYAAFVRRQFVSVKPIREGVLDWIFEKYPTENDAPDDLASVLCKRYGVSPRVNPKVITPEQHLDLVLLKDRVGTYAMGTLISLPEADYIAYMGERASNVVAKSTIKRSGVNIHSYWNPMRILTNE